MVYKRLDYLLFSGQQYINTGVLIKNTIGCKIKYLRSKPFGSGESGATNVLGVRAVTNANNCWVPPNMTGETGEFYCHFGTNTSIKASPAKYGSLNEDYTVEHNYYNCGKSYINGDFFAEYDTSQFTENNYCTYPLHIGTFVLNTGIYATYNWQGRIYYCIITDGDTVIRHYIPCLDEKGKPCFYDLINQTANYTANSSYGFPIEPLFLSTKDIILPERYLKLEWLQSLPCAIDRCFINTEIKPNQNTGFDIDFEITTESTEVLSAAIFGARTSSGNKELQFSRYNNGILRFGNNYTLSAKFNKNERYQASLRNRVFTHVDKTIYNLPTNSWQGDYNLYLFSLNESNNSTQGAGSKIYRFKLYDGDNLIKDFIPAFDTYNYTYCMYDIINEKPYYVNKNNNFNSNRDSGENNQLGILHKLPEGFTKVNYLIANGSQYIDTNYVPTNETGYYLEGQSYSNSESYWFGSRNDASTDTRIYLHSHPRVGWGWMTYGDLTTDTQYFRQELKSSFNFLNDRKLTTTINEKVFIYNLPDLNFTPSQSIFIFNFNRGGVPYGNLGHKGRIDTFLISEGDQIVRQFVPCLDADGFPCMYELYTGTAHYNQGSGQFSYPREYTNDPINLPAGYTKCVYLQSNGTQWIDTGIIPNADTGLYLRAQHLNYGDFVPFGSWENSSAYFYPPRFNATNKSGTYSFGTTYQMGFYYDKGDDLVFTSTMNLYNDRTVNFWSEDTNWFGIISVNPTVTFTRSLWLFSYNMDNATINATYAKWGGRIFRAKITQGDTLVHDFVPSLDENKRPCMYDLVTQTPFYNQSGGEDFAYCVEHELPSNFAKLDYIESTGTQYIKTGYVPTNTTGIYVDAYNNWTTTTNWTQPISLRETNGNTYVSVGRVLRESSGAGFGWGAYTTTGGTGNVRYEATLNFLNNRQSIITAPSFAQRVNALGDLPFTPTFDLCMFGMHNYDGTYGSAGYRIYRAKISEGSEIVRDYVPAYDALKDKPCMYDLINNVAYYNDGTGEFVMPPKREGSYTGFAQLGGIGNRLGGNAIFFENNDDIPENDGDYIFLDFISIESDEFIDTEVPINGNEEWTIQISGKNYGIYEYEFDDTKRDFLFLNIVNNSSQGLMLRDDDADKAKMYSLTGNQSIPTEDDDFYFIEIKIPNLAVSIYGENVIGDSNNEITIEMSSISNGVTLELNKALGVPVSGVAISTFQSAGYVRIYSFNKNGTLMVPVYCKSEDKNGLLINGNKFVPIKKK